MPVDEDKADIRKGDQEEIASLHQNLYLTCFADRDYQAALDHVHQCIDIIKAVHSPRSKKLASKYY